LERAGEHADVLAGAQGDEPDLEAGDLARLVGAFADPTVEMATLCVEIDEAAAFAAPSVVKVVRDARGDALYFSRAPIPAASHGDPAAARALRHVGVYAYRPAALRAFTALPRGDLERRESLEQLRWLEAGRRLRVVDARRAPRGIDTLEDYHEFVRRLARGSAEGGTGTFAGTGGARAEARAG
jgi:3-deoxy-manno-octulosonate cytidylyltransferase (CMP-KDO synthetase)